MAHFRSVVIFGAALLAGLATESTAQLTITGPATSQIDACEDFAIQNVKDAWDFSNPEDILTNIQPQQLSNLTDPTFANGVVSFTATSSDPHFTLTTIQSPGSIAVPDEVRYGTVFPIDTSRYSSISVRMFTNVNSFIQIYWATSDSFGITAPVNTYAGEWRTYTIDLATQGRSDGNGPSANWVSGNKNQIRIDPSHISGAEVKIDWIQLTRAPSSCGSLSSTFQGGAQKAAAIVVDSDSNLTNGAFEHTVVPLTGGSQSTSFSSSRLFPGAYQVYGFQTDDYATAWGNPWDMRDSVDVDSARIFNISNARFESNKFCGTTTSTDGNFYMALPKKALISAALFKYLTIKLEIANPAQVTVSNAQFFNSAGALLGAVNDLTYDSVNRLVEFDLSGAAGWAGEITSLRIQPTTTVGVPFCVDWVALTTSLPATAAEPTLPALTSAPGTVTIKTSELVGFIQPDKKGGRDCPTHDLGNPWVMDSQSDIQGLTDVENGKFYPHNPISDPRGVLRSGDFFGGFAKVGSDDPKVHPLLFSSSINADRCVHFCYSLINKFPVQIFQSVARVTYLNAAGAPQDGDDVINPDRWKDSEVCLYMPELQQEPVIAPGQTHPWRGAVDFLSLDPHEERDGTEFFIDYIELREDHKASGLFTVVVDAPLTQPVELYFSTQRPSSKRELPAGAVQVATLLAGRNSNVHLWNTTGLAQGRYYLSARTNLLSAAPVVNNAPLPVVIDSAFSDTVGPTQLIDSPLAGRRVASSLQVAGAVFDNIRDAVTELYIDGQWQRQFVPDLYHARARQDFRSTAPDKPGFNFAVDVTGLSAGAHTVTLVSYDTTGNKTTYSVQITKGTENDPEVEYPVPNATPVGFSPSARSLTVTATGTSVQVLASGYDGCGSVAVLASKFSDFSEAVTLFNGRGSQLKNATNISQWVTASALTGESQQRLSQRAKRPVPIQLKPDELIQQDGVTCGLIKERWIPGSLDGKGRFLSLTDQIALARLKLATTKNARVKKQQQDAIKKLKVQSKLQAVTCQTLGRVPGVAPQVPEDGVIYFQARCSGASPSNTVSVNFGTQISNAAKTTPFETAILQELQAQMSAR